MANWSIEVEFSRENQEVEENALDELVDLLVDVGVAASLDAHRLRVRISLEAKSVVDAIAAGVAQVENAGLKAGLPTDTILGVSAQSDQGLELELEESNLPALVGVAELADRLQVSRQRVSQLAKSRTLPTPVASLAAGPVWLRSSIETFVDGWQRRPGRPQRSPVQTSPPPPLPIESLQPEVQGKPVSSSKTSTPEEFECSILDGVLGAELQPHHMNPVHLKAILRLIAGRGFEPKASYIREVRIRPPEWPPAPTWDQVDPSTSDLTDKG